LEMSFVSGVEGLGKAFVCGSEGPDKGNMKGHGKNLEGSKVGDLEDTEKAYVRGLGDLETDNETGYEEGLELGVVCNKKDLEKGYRKAFEKRNGNAYDKNFEVSFVNGLEDLVNAFVRGLEGLEKGNVKGQEKNLEGSFVSGLEGLEKAFVRGLEGLEKDNVKGYAEGLELGVACNLKALEENYVKSFEMNFVCGFMGLEKTYVSGLKGIVKGNDKGCVLSLGLRLVNGRNGNVKNYGKTFGSGLVVYMKTKVKRLREGSGLVSGLVGYGKAKRVRL
jgi:hypothetical protein